MLEAFLVPGGPDLPLIPAMVLLDTPWTPGVVSTYHHYAIFRLQEFESCGPEVRVGRPDPELCNRLTP